MKENLLLVITPLKIKNECFETITNLYEKKDPTQKRALNNKLCKMKMERDETGTSFFTNILEVKDLLALEFVLRIQNFKAHTSQVGKLRFKE